MGKCFSPSVGSSFSGTYCPEVAVSHECIKTVTKHTSHCSQDTVAQQKLDQRGCPYPNGQYTELIGFTKLTKLTKLTTLAKLNYVTKLN